MREAARRCPTKPCWKPRKRGVDYKDKTLTPNGIQTITLREGAMKKSRITLRAKGANLKLPNLTTLTGTLEVQLQRQSDPCFSAIFSAPFNKQTKNRLVDKSN